MKLWQIPDSGIVGSLTDWIVDLRGHMKKISYIEWHPTAANILLSSAADFKVVTYILDIKYSSSVANSSGLTQSLRISAFDLRAPGVVLI